MSLEPQAPIPVTRDVRETARRQADRLAGGGVVIVGVVGALILMAAFVVLDYVFNQDPHRILKVFLGATALLGIIAVPNVGLLVFPIAVPLLSWVPPLPVPGLNALNILLFSVFGMFALGRVLRRQPVFRTPSLKGVLLTFIVLAGLSIVRGAAFPTGFRYEAGYTSLMLFRTIVGFAPYVIVLAMVRGESARRRVAWGVVAGLIVESVVTIVLGRNGSGARAIGSIGQANELGTFLATYAVFALALMLGTRHLFGKFMLLASFVAGSFGVMLSLSRGAMLSLIAGVLLVALRGSRVLLVLCIGLLVTSPLWAPDYVIERVMESRQVDEGSDEASIDSASEARVQTWSAIFEVVRDHPLDGVGFAGLAFVLPDVSTELGLEEARDSAHNTYMRMLGEMGILGVALFVFILWKLWELGDRVVRKPASRFDRALGLGLCAGVLSMAVSCAFGDRFFNVQLSAGLWIVAGLVEDGWRESREQVA